MSTFIDKFIQSLLICMTLVSSVSICNDPHSKTLYATRNESCSPPYQRFYSVQMNIFDAWWEWSGVDSISGPVNKSDAEKAVMDYLNNNFTIYRFFGYLFGTTMDVWLYNETYFWSMYDEYYAYLTAINQNKTISNKIFVIPSLGYSQWYEITTNNETLNDLVTNNQSQSRQLMYKYLNEYITKYKDMECILMWELGNELNLLVDLPNRAPSDTFSTPEMVQYIQEIVSFIRNIDNIRPISSGYSCPRPSAWHLYYNQSWVIDTKEQWQYMLAWQNEPVDVISCHNYGNDPFFNEPFGDTQQFYAAAQVADNENKLLYLGEFGPFDQNYSNPNSTQFVYNTIDAMIDIFHNYTVSPWMLSTIWAWEDYTHGNTLLYPKRPSSIPILNYMQQANSKMIPYAL